MNKKVLLFLVLLCVISFAGCKDDTNTLKKEVELLYNYPAQQVAELFEESKPDFLLLSFADKSEIGLIMFSHINGKLDYNGDIQSRRKYIDLQVYGTPKMGSAVWPKMNIEVNSGGLKIEDWSDFTKLNIDLKNNSGRQINFYIHFWDINNKMYKTYDITLSAESEWTVFECVLDFSVNTATDGEYSGFDYTQIAGLSMFFANPADETPICISLDNLRLVK